MCAKICVLGVYIYTNIIKWFILATFLKYYQQESAKLRQQIVSIQNSNRLILSE